MKIAIVTVYDGLNHGSFLQAYALKTYLEELGHEVSFLQRMEPQETLNMFTVKKPETECDILHKIWRKCKKIVQIKKIYREIKYVKIKFKYYEKACENFNIITKNELKNIDCIICGSDEIWNIKNAYIDIKFYTCCGYGKKIRKIAIAISCGNSKYSDILEEREVIKAIKEFDTLLARDNNTKYILEKIQNKKINIVCDPTLLIDKQYYLENKDPIISGKYILVYSYMLTKKQEIIIKEYARKNKLEIISACSELKIADKNIVISPLDFANLMKNAECCFTTTFHGAIFAMLFAKRFCCFAAFPKVKDVVETCGAKYHLWDGLNEKIFDEIMGKDIDRKKLDNNIEIFRDSSRKLINDVLIEREK